MDVLLAVYETNLSLDEGSSNVIKRVFSNDTHKSFMISQTAIGRFIMGHYASCLSTNSLQANKITNDRDKNRTVL